MENNYNTKYRMSNTANCEFLDVLCRNQALVEHYVEIKQ